MVAGALLVPIGTLTVTTGSFIPQTVGESVLPLPTRRGAACPLHIAMNENATVDTFAPAFSRSDLILELAASSFYGDTISLTEKLPQIPQEIGPSPHLAIAFHHDVVYHDIVTYTWTGNCRSAESEISYGLDLLGLPKVNFTFPDGSHNQSTLNILDPRRLGRQYIWNDSKKWSNGIPHGGSNYWAVSILANTTTSKSYEEQLNAEINATGILYDSGIWIARVKCTPTIVWQVSSCTWNGQFMEKCTPSPDKNVTDLDTIGLDALHEYINAVPWSLLRDEAAIFFANPFPGYSPSASHFEILAGMIAQSVVTSASRVEWGTRLIRTVGEPAKVVYMVRVQFAVIVFLMVFLATLMACADYFSSVLTKTPFRKTTFLSVAGAVRGPFWDDELGSRSQPRQKKDQHDTMIKLSSTNQILEQTDFLVCSDTHKSSASAIVEESLGKLNCSHWEPFSSTFMDEEEECNCVATHSRMRFYGSRKSGE
jgi:hypothetical protein